MPLDKAFCPKFCLSQPMCSINGYPTGMYSFECAWRRWKATWGRQLGVIMPWAHRDAIWKWYALYIIHSKNIVLFYNFFIRQVPWKFYDDWVEDWCRGVTVRHSRWDPGFESHCRQVLLFFSKTLISTLLLSPVKWLYWPECSPGSGKSALWVQNCFWIQWPR